MLRALQVSLAGLLACLACSSRAERPSQSRDRQGRDERARQPDAAISADKIVSVSYYTEKTACEIHGDKMLEALVPIGYGLVFSDKRYLEAYGSLFPNAVTVLGGGCVAGGETHARVKYCPACRAARQRWMAARPGIRELGD
jgi:hypothetical protein